MWSNGVRALSDQLHSEQIKHLSWLSDHFCLLVENITLEVRERPEFTPGGAEIFRGHLLNWPHTRRGRDFFGLCSGGTRPIFNLLGGGPGYLSHYTWQKISPKWLKNTFFACFGVFQAIMFFKSNHHEEGGTAFNFQSCGRGTRLFSGKQ